MTARTTITDHYIADITISLSSQNQYNETIDSGVIAYTKKLKVNGMAGLSYLLAQLDQSLENVKETNK